MLGEIEMGAAGVDAALERNLVAPPVELVVITVVCNGEELNQARDGTSSRERCRQDEVVLGPECQVACLGPEPRSSSDGNGRPAKGEVSRSPVEGTAKHDDGVSVADESASGPLSANEVKQENHDETEREANKGRGVSATRTPESLGTDGTPEHSSREEGVLAGAEELERSILSTDISDVDLVLDDANVDECGNQSRNHLGKEGEARGNLNVVGKLEIVGEAERVGAGDVAVRLEEAHGQGVAFDKRATDELGQDVEGDLNTSHGVDNADGDDEDEAERNAVEDNADGGVRRPLRNGNTTENNGNDQADEIPPLRNLLVGGHEAVVDIDDADRVVLLLLAAEAVDEVANTHHDLDAVIERSISNDRCVNGEKEHVDDSVGGGEVGPGIRVVLIHINDTTVIEYTADVVSLSESVIGLVAVDGDEGSTPGVGVENSHDDEAGEEHADECVEGREEGYHERIDDVGDDSPVESGNRVVAEAGAEIAAGDLRENLVLGGDPSHPCKDSKSREDSVGEPEEKPHAEESHAKELKARHGPDLLEGALDRRVAVGMEGTVERNGDKRLRPDTVRGVDEKSSAETSQTVANEVGREGSEHLVGEAASPGLIKPLRHDLNPDDVVGVGGRLGDGGHDGDEHVLLLVEGTGVQAVASAEEGESPIREYLGEEDADGVGKKLRDVLQDADGRVTNLEETINGSNSAREGDTDDPCTNGGAGHGGIIVVVDNRSHLGVGRVVGDEGSLNLHLVDELLVLLGALKDVLVGQKFFNFVESGLRKVGVTAMQGPNLLHELREVLATAEKSQTNGIELLTSRVCSSE